MGARKRESVQPAASSESQMTYSRFLDLFPDNDACVAYLKNKFYPDGSECPGCGKATKFHRIRGRAAYSCQFCGQQVYPTAGTIFHKSTTSLQLWFWAIFLMSSTRCGISAKQLEREIGVTYPTAHRMFKQIRTLLHDDDGPLSGEVEVDETWVGGRPRLSDQRKPGYSGAKWREAKTPVFAAGERGGRVRTKVGRHRSDAWTHVFSTVMPGTTVFTDEYPAYRSIHRQYDHKRINHSTRVYVEGNVHTQSVEGFFALFKTGMAGVYHSVSTQYLQSYLDEYTFRFNRRDGRAPIFWAILDRVQKPQLGAA